MREWDRFGSEVYVYGLGLQPVELDKKYYVNMEIYKLKKAKPQIFEMSEEAK